MEVGIGDTEEGRKEGSKEGMESREGWRKGGRKSNTFLTFKTSQQMIFD